MLHIVKYLGAVLPRSVESWGRQEVVLAFLAYAFVAGVVFAAAFGVNSSTETNLLATKGVVALSIAAVILLVVHVLVLTPAKMWDEAQREIKDLQEKGNADQPTAVKSEGQIGGQTAYNIFNVGQDKVRLVAVRDTLTVFIAQGHTLFKEGIETATDDTLDEWTGRTHKWVTATATYLRGNLSEAAVVVFTDMTSALPFSFRDDLGDGHNQNLRWLDRSLGNLRKILVGLQA